MSQADLNGSYSVLADSVCTSHHFKLNHSTTLTLLEAQTGFFLICLHAYPFTSYRRKALRGRRGRCAVLEPLELVSSDSSLAIWLCVKK